MSSALAIDDPFADIEGDPDSLRWYQREAYEAAHVELAKPAVRCTMVVMATGTGKTRLFSTIAKHWPGNVLFLSHRDELVEQSRREVERATGEWVEVEKAEFRCGPHTRLVVGSVQTLCKLARLETLGKERFSLIVIDEFHHAVAPSYGTIMAYFGAAKVLGVTATPDRGDKKAMGKAADSVAYTFDIADGIEHGYLVPVEAERVRVEEINLEDVGVSKGDLAEKALDVKMCEAVEGVVAGMIQHSGDQQAIVFFPGIKSAELACARFNTIRPNSAIFICAQTDKDERKGLVRGFHRGDYQFFCNVGIATEGFDAPKVCVVGIARPTLSRALYAQMAGRGTRPWAGTIDHCEGRELAQLRKQLISRSAKPHMKLLDFVGNSGKHSLVGPLDILGGDYSDEEVKRAKKKAEKDGSANPRKLLEDARAELRALAAKTASKVKLAKEKFDPFKVLDMPPGEDHLSAGYKPLTPGLRNALLNFGLKDKEMDGMSRNDGERFIAAQRARMKAGLCSYKQLKMLQKFGINDTSVAFDRAKAAMNYLEQKGWGQRGPIDPHKLLAIVNHRRQPGDDGP